MPDFQDGQDLFSSTSRAGVMPVCVSSQNSLLPPSALAATSALVEPWSMLPGSEEANAGTALSVPFAYQSARWERIARRVWSGRNDAEIPQWIRQDMSPSARLNSDMEEEAQLPLHYGIRAIDLLPMERAALAGLPVASDVRLIPLAAAKRTTYMQAPKPGGSSASDAGGRAASGSASILQFPAGLEYVFPDERMPPDYSDETPMAFCSSARQTISVFSLTGGAGRTSISAGLARVLAGSGLRVLLADTSAYSLLPRLFGGGDSRQGVLRKFVPLTGGRNQMMSQVSLAVESFAGDDVEQYRILHEFSRETSSMDRIIWDLGGAPLDWAAKVLRISTQILIPLLPNMQSLVQLRATSCFLDRVQEGRSSLNWNYVLNGFDEQDPSHMDIRGRLRQVLGDQLLEESVRSSPMVDEALSKGRTVFDHAPESDLAGDMWRLGCRIRQVDESAGDTVPVASEWVESQAG